MALISTEDAKAYLRVDSSDEDATVGILLASAIRLCIDIARLTDDQWEVVDSDAASSDEYTEAELSARSLSSIPVPISLSTGRKPTTMLLP